jgi:hypothetical protein
VISAILHPSSGSLRVHRPAGSDFVRFSPAQSLKPGDSERLERSWNRYMRTNEDFRKILAEFEKSMPQGRHTTNANPEDALDELALILEGGRSTRPTELSVRLHTSCKPYDTNGKTDEQALEVEWTDVYLNPQFPTLCYASWSEPDGQFQNQHFGSVVLEEGDLARYALWCRDLTVEAGAEWERVLDELKPTEELGERLEAFRFSNGAAAHGAELLRKSILKKREESKVKPRP